MFSMLILLNVQRKPSRKLVWFSFRLFASFAALPAQAQSLDAQPSTVVQVSPSDAPSPEADLAPELVDGLSRAPAVAPEEAEVAPVPARPRLSLRANSSMPPNGPLEDARERREALQARVERANQELRDVRALNREAGPTGFAKTCMFMGLGVTAFGVAVGVSALVLTGMPHGGSGPDGDMLRASAIAHGIGVPLALTSFALLRRQQRKQPYRVDELLLRRELHTLRNQLQHVRRDIRRLETFGPTASFDRHGARLALGFRF